MCVHLSFLYSLCVIFHFFIFSITLSLFYVNILSNAMIFAIHLYFSVSYKGLVWFFARPQYPPSNNLLNYLNYVSLLRCSPPFCFSPGVPLSLNSLLLFLFPFNYLSCYIYFLLYIYMRVKLDVLNLLLLIMIMIPMRLLILLCLHWACTYNLYINLYLYCLCAYLRM